MEAVPKAVVKGRRKKLSGSIKATYTCREMEVMQKKSEEEGGV